MMRSWCLAAAIMAAGSVATAQSIQLAPLENTQAPADIPEGALVFLPSYHFHLNMAHLSSDSPRYNWEANYGGELGIVAYGRTQLTFVANYQAVLGEEFHPVRSEPGQLPPRRRAEHAVQGGLRGRRVPPPVASSRRPRRRSPRWTGT